MKVTRENLRTWTLDGLTVKEDEDGDIRLPSTIFSNHAKIRTLALILAAVADDLEV